jgi:uncharacterized protein
MRCPNDQATLVMTERSGVEIDYCPECRGVWLDRGELDKIIDRVGGPGTDAGGAAVPGVAPVAAPGADPYGAQRYGAPQHGAPQYATPQYGAPGMAVPRGGYASPGSPGSPASWDRGGRRGSGQQQYGGQQYGGQQPYGRKRRGNWVSELFD